MKATLAPAATRDLLEATEAIARDSRRAARAFHGAIDQALTMIGRHPEIGPERLDLAPPPIRFWTLRRFPYVMAYNANRAPPRVLRVVHGARDLPDLFSGLRQD